MSAPRANGTRWPVDAFNWPPAPGGPIEMACSASTTRSPGGTMMGDEEARPPESGTPPPRGVVAGLMLPGHMLLGGPVAVVAAEWVIVDSWEVLVARPVRAPVVAAGVVAAGVVAAGVVAAGVVA